MDDELAVRLRAHLQRLQSIVPVLSTAVLALRGQNAELDEDIARILARHACDPLDEEITQLEALIDSLGFGDPSWPSEGEGGQLTLGTGDGD